MNNDELFRFMKDKRNYTIKEETIKPLGRHSVSYGMDILIGDSVEFRFLTRSTKNKQKIGEISKVYFGNPYEGLRNTENIVKESNSLRRYLKYKNQLIELCESKKIEYQNYSYPHK